MANYKPNAIQIDAIASGTVDANLSTEYWGLTFLRGIARNPASAPIASGAVAIWEGSTLTTADPTHVTFSNTDGAFGVTVKSNVDLVIKAYTR